MKRTGRARRHSSVLLIILAAGCSSVMVQLTMIRELLAGFEGNEFVVSLALLCWLAAGGLGSLAAWWARVVFGAPSARSLALASFPLAVLPVLQVLTVRAIRSQVLVEGASTGFLPTISCTAFMTGPFALVVGFILPWSLYVIRTGDGRYPAGRLYIVDCMGATLGGLVFTWVLVEWVTPMGILVVSSIVLLAALLRLLSVAQAGMITAAAMVFMVLAAGIAGVGLEAFTLAPRGAHLVEYRESRFGRVTLVRDHGLHTIFLDGMPAISGQDRVAAEEAAHFALAQVRRPRHVLLISPGGGMVEEVLRHGPVSIDYARTDPTVISLELAHGLLGAHAGLRVVPEDPRVYLKGTTKTYDAICVDEPEPRTFQSNRFFTREFMELARAHLNEGGVLSLSVEGYESYISEPARRRVSSLFNTAGAVFGHVLVLPGQRVFLIAGDRPMDADIPSLLERKEIRTDYISGYFSGDVSPDRIHGLMAQLDPAAPLNTDFEPYLVRLALDSWALKHAARPWILILGLGVFCALYLPRLTSREFTLFTTGCVNLGSEILTIVLFQILFGYLYYRIGLIVTVFLAGLMPGAWVAGRLSRGVRGVLMATDAGIAGILGILAAILASEPGLLSQWFFYAFGFVISVLCGLQFPLVAGITPGQDSMAARAFSVDLVGAAFGCILVSALFIPFLGIVSACLALIGLKVASIMVQAVSAHDH
ncbi:MAG TPA: fused MFS/spermidine synthase [Deltaproteobacteria bacterium]|nr:fused MFS/spermidine synthase [Deltaproteobacteria bacterium]